MRAHAQKEMHTIMMLKPFKLHRSGEGSRVEYLIVVFSKCEKTLTLKGIEPKHATPSLSVERARPRNVFWTLNNQNVTSPRPGGGRGGFSGLWHINFSKQGSACLWFISFSKWKMRKIVRIKLQKKSLSQEYSRFKTRNVIVCALAHNTYIWHTCHP